MNKRKALFIEIDPAGPTGEDLHMVRDYGGLGYVIVPVLPSAEAVELREAVRARTGARVTRALELNGTHRPEPVWAIARALEIDLDRSVFASRSATHEGAFLTAGIRRVLRVGRDLAAA